jgi:hypothetical protein
MNRFLTGIVAACALVFAGQLLAQETLTVWWVKGFYKSEDDALFRGDQGSRRDQRSRSSCRSIPCRT